MTWMLGTNHFDRIGDVPCVQIHFSLQLQSSSKEIASSRERGLNQVSGVNNIADDMWVGRGRTRLRVAVIESRECVREDADREQIS